MDRRQKKTRDAIFKAFSSLVEHKRYENITVQDIIDEANIGRSTFYSHFETKDMLVKSLCGDIFEHIFEDEICSYHDDTKSIETRLAHLLWHLHEHKSEVFGMLKSQSSDVFIRYLKEYLLCLFKLHLAEFHADVPQDFFLNHLVGSFCELIKWWVANDMTEKPDVVAKYFMAVTETH